MKRTHTYKGQLRTNIYGNWSDVDKGLFIDGTPIEEIFCKFEGRTIEITIGEIEEKKEE